MAPPLRVTLLLSFGAHAALLAGLPVTSQVAFDVERAPSSMEIILATSRPELAVKFPAVLDKLPSHH